MEEPFDELGGPRAATSTSNHRSGAPPPASAFHAPASAAPAPKATPRNSTGPPSNAFSSDPLPSRWAQYDNQMEPSSSPAAAPAPVSVTPPSVAAPPRQSFEPEDELDLLATGAMKVTPTSSGRSFADYKNSRASLTEGTAPSSTSYASTNSAYSFKRSESYDTADLIRKYGGYRPENQLLARGGAGGTTPSPPANADQDVVPDRSIRDQAMKVLSLVDEQLKTPMEVRRTESGGFRAQPPIAKHDSSYSVRRTTSGRIVQEENRLGDSYSVTRTASGTVQSGQNLTGSGRRVPSALAGLNMSRQDSRGKSDINGRPGRYSFSDPNFRDDEDLSEEEDDIMRGPDFRNIPECNEDPVLNDAPLVDVVSLEQRSAGSRAVSNKNRTFSGDYNYSESANSTPPRPTNNWSSRYFSAGGADYTKDQQDRFLDRLDRENKDEGGFSAISARQMFASSASSVRSAIDHVSRKATESAPQVFGSGSFRSTPGFGHHPPQDNSVNLRTVWKDSTDEGSSVLPHKPPVHKTWQEAMLNKRRRRRIFMGLFLFIAIAAIVIPTVLKTRDNNVDSGTVSSAATGGNDDRNYVPPPRVPNTVDEDDEPRTTFYVTSDVPYDSTQEEKFTKDLENLSLDAEFIVHLGNIQEAAVSFCPKSRYTDVAAMMMNSPVPMFVVPGAEDWLNCPNPAYSLTQWDETFDQFQDNFSNSFDDYGLDGTPGIFNMLHDGVLFFGLHLVNGQTDDADEWTARHMAQVKFYFGMLKNYEGQFRAIVLLGNGRPSPQQMEFWNPLFTSLEPVGVPVLYLHANSGNDRGVEQYTPFEEHPKLLAVEAQNGGKNPPLKIGIAYESDRPFFIG